MTNPAAVNRPLTDAERTLIKQVCIWSVAEQKGITDEMASAALERLIEREGIFMEGDAHDVWVKRGTPAKPGRVLIHCTREWLSFYASNPDEPIDFYEHMVLLDDNEDGTA